LPFAIHSLALMTVAVSLAGLGTSHAAAQTDSSKIGPDGTAFVTRVIPVPTTICPEAQQSPCDSAIRPCGFCGRRATRERPHPMPVSREGAVPLG